MSRSRRAVDWDLFGEKMKCQVLWFRYGLSVFTPGPQGFMCWDLAER
jgi:hypothetical protein